MEKNCRNCINSFIKYQFDKDYLYCGKDEEDIAIDESLIKKNLPCWEGVNEETLKKYRNKTD